MPNPKLHRFTVDRSKWLAGHLGEHQADYISTLLDDEGRMCCVGFYALSIGLSPKMIRNHAKLSYLDDSERSRCPIDGDSLDAMYTRNDRSSGTRLAREQAIAKLFKKHNVAVKFVGRYPK